MNTTIKSKLFVGISLILVLLVGTIFYVFFQLAESNKRLTHLVDNSAERILLSNEVMYDVMEITRNEKNVILENDLSDIESYEKAISVSFLNIKKNLRLLEENSGTDGGKIIEEFKPFWKQYSNVLSEIIKQLKAGEEDTAFSLSINEARESREAVISLMEELIDLNKERMLAEKLNNQEAYQSSIRIIIILTVLSLFLSALLAYWIIESISRRIKLISDTAQKIASRELEQISKKDNINDELEPVADSLADILESFREVASNAQLIASGNYGVRINPKSSNDFLGNALNEMSLTLEKTTAINKKHNWLTTGQNLLNETLRGEQSVEEAAEKTINFLSEYTQSNIGAIYINEKNRKLNFLSGFAFSPNEIKKTTYAFGEGLPGQAAAGKKLIHLKDVHQENIRISSSIVDAKPAHIVVVPFFKDVELMGVIELGKLSPFSEKEIEFIQQSTLIIGVAISLAISRKKIQELLDETQTQSEELQVQQEELRQTNEELEEQTQNLKNQQEELQVANEELEEQAQRVEQKNHDLELAQAEIEKKNQEIIQSSRYKSQFLANMSHELRTPLNSLLILSRDLAENKKQNLDESQVESANIIYKSGNDLLQLINEVLDLSKIEAGKMDLEMEEISLDDFAKSIHRNFDHLAREKGLELHVQKDENLPGTIYSDPQRLDQIIKNLISNAIKFTEKGSVTVSINGHENDFLQIEVRDTGIGIAPEKQKVIFEAFQQADGSTSRKYGGTGLGLSISKELSRLLGGEISLSSTKNEGSVFTLTIPQKANSIPPVVPEIKKQEPPVTIIRNNEKYLNYPSVPDDRNDIKKEDKIILIIEDDLNFAKILVRQAREKGFKVIAASSGEDGLLLAKKFFPKAIILDIGLPGIDGNMVLTQLKADPSLRHISVHIISAEERTLDPIHAGAVEYLMKPVEKEHLEEAFLRIENFINRRMKNLLIIEDDINSRKSIKILIGNGDVKCFEAGSGKEALKILQDHPIDCIVLDLGLPDISGFDLIKKIQVQKEKVPPIIIYTGRELSREENEELQNFAESIIIKGVKSEERLLDETALFLHRTVGNLPNHKQEIIKDLYKNETVFQDKKILLVDDDMRNIFALSKVLKEHGMQIIKAENGVKAIQALESNPDVSLVLMDVMMPVMDGLEATEKIRKMEEFKNLPIISVTAKAMKEDRIKCLEAGANDYISKPIELEKLLSLMKIWIKK